MQELFGGYSSLINDRNKLEGGRKFIQNSVGAISGFTSKITGTLSNYLSLATQDEEFIKERKEHKYKHRPQNSGDGVFNGVKSLVKSVYSGVSGTVVLPIRGYQEEGVKGAFIGAGKGTIGLVLKPISGLIDVVSISSEGVRNHVSSY
mmetsp:Transcript_52443/g.114745  ORF Transcript_52443/g.114745 Transcript_52443/m.114745 type:complete len:148 (-) Transcript_52443:1081-1524(-)